MRLYILYDGQAMSDIDNAVIHTTENTLEEAKESINDYGDGCCYSYAVTAEHTLVDERFEFQVIDGRMS